LSRVTEPDFRIGCLNRDGNALPRLEIEALRYMPLTDDQVSELMDRLKQRFPIATDFGGREPAERPARGLAGGFLNIKEVFTPATGDEIDSYREVAYPKWIEGCERIFRNLHEIVESEDDVPAFWFAVVNEGTRPAKDALITIETKGDFAIMPLAREDDVGKEPDHKPLALCSPPTPPRGIWRPKPLMGALDSISAVQRAMGSYARPLVPDIVSRIPSLPDLNPRRDRSRAGQRLLFRHLVWNASNGVTASNRSCSAAKSISTRSGLQLRARWSAGFMQRTSRTLLSCAYRSAFKFGRRKRMGQLRRWFNGSSRAVASDDRSVLQKFLREPVNSVSRQQQQAWV
jgi:hypothetical protein